MHEQAYYYVSLQATDCGGTLLAATWSDTGKVHIWDLSRPFEAINDPIVMSEYTLNRESPQALFTFIGHQAEGFALDWAQTSPGRI